jgi:hypothetical protein
VPIVALLARRRSYSCSFSVQRCSSSRVCSRVDTVHGRLHKLMEVLCAEHRTRAEMCSLLPRNRPYLLHSKQRTYTTETSRSICLDCILEVLSPSLYLLETVERLVDTCDLRSCNIIPSLFIVYNQVVARNPALARDTEPKVRHLSVCLLQWRNSNPLSAIKVLDQGFHLR